MTTLLHLLTAAAVFVHATLGCCAHEGHDARVVESKPNGCCSCHHHSSHQQDHGRDDLSKDDLSQKGQQPVPHECSHADCKWPAPEARTCHDLLLLSHAEIVSWTSTTSLASFFDNGSVSPLLLPDLSLHTLPVRLHLAHSVLLI